jgi:hypothetical protein
MFQHEVTTEDGELLDIKPFCSDGCHQDWCRENGVKYPGWNLAPEAPADTYCAQCGTVTDYLSCGCWSYVAHRFRVDVPELCECGNPIQIAMED